MRFHRRQFLHLAAGAVALPAVSRNADAQSYPTRPITMIVPFPAGGGTDTVGRIVAERMRVSLGQPVVIENVTGANGTIGTGRVARAAPDGYTVVFGIWNTHVANGALYPLQYDVLKDFEPIALIASYPYLIVANKTIPASDLKGLVTWLKANPGKATAATVRCGKRTACWERSAAENDRHPLSIRPLSRRRPGHAGFIGRSRRLDDGGAGD